MASRTPCERSSSRGAEEFRRRAVDLVRESEESVAAVARQLGISVSSLRKWMAQEEIDQGPRSGVSTEEKKELTRSRRENRVLRTGA